jgi:GTP pyrophosphokinase
MHIYTLEELKKILRQRFPGASLQVIDDAYVFANDAHKGQVRKTGEPYVNHSLATATKLANMRVDLNTVAAGLLHDVPEDTEATLEDIKTLFGDEIASLVEGVTKLSVLKYRGMERYVENLRKMFIALSDDIRVILIKFADRIHNLETLEALPDEKRKRIAVESMEIFAPIAHRLGMWDIKGQLEDLSFKYTDPEGFKWVSQLVHNTAPEKEQSLDSVVRLLHNELTKDPRLKVYAIQGRAKHLYSLYNKLERHDRDINQIYDLIAVRVVVDSIAECYNVLGIIHQLWKPLRGRVKDYIAHPKPNGYQSLHTTVFVGEGEIIEFQIRTKQMDDESNYGPAAHWFYNESGKPKKGTKVTGDQYKWVKELVELQKEIKDTAQYLESVKLNVFPESIFVFTPKGDVISLPYQATPIDFAYHVHTDLGNQIVGSRVNNKIMPIVTPLKSGDVVEVIADKNRSRPSADWLNVVKTRTAKDHIKNSIKKQRRLFGLFRGN